MSRIEHDIGGNCAHKDICMYSFTEVQLRSSSAGCFFACIPLIPLKNKHSWGTVFLEKTTQATLIPYISLFYYTPSRVFNF
jgi:hypothetical protein